MSVVVVYISDSSPFRPPFTAIGSARCGSQNVRRARAAEREGGVSSRMVGQPSTTPCSSSSC